MSPLLIAAALTAASPTDATPAPAPAPDQAPVPVLPPEVRAVIEAAIASKDPAAVETVVRFARAAHPAAEAEIAAIHRAFTEERAAETRRAEQERRERLAAAGPLDHWRGQLEVGAVRATGSSDHLGLFAALSGERQGIDWTHNVAGRVEVQESGGSRTVERMSASWQPRRRLGPRLYGYGLAQVERDPFLGFDGRYTAGVGAGYRLVDEGNIRLRLEGGPAFRRTDARTLQDFSSLAARASVDLAWRVAPQLEIKQVGTLFVDRENGNGTATTSLDTRLLGPLRMRLSYELRYEEDVLRQVDTLDTTSRATLVLGF